MIDDIMMGYEEKGCRQKVGGFGYQEPAIRLKTDDDFST